MTEPYYADEHVTLYLGDVRELLPTLDISPDAAICDLDWADLIRFKRELISDADLIDSTVELVERRADELERGTP